MTSESEPTVVQTNGVPTPPPLPTWIEAPLFEPVLREICPDLKKINVFNAKPALCAGENYATVMLRLDVEVELSDGSSQNVPLMNKTAHDNDMFREMMKSHNIFDVESTVYREIVPEFEELYREVGIDIRFGAKSYKLDTENPYILLEDLSIHGFKNMNRLDGLDVEHIQAVLIKLAQWHAASAVRVATKGHYKPLIKKGLFLEESREMIKAMFDSFYPVFLNCAKSYHGHEDYYTALEAMRNNLVDRQYNAQQQEGNEFLVLNHGDCWSNNIMFLHDAVGKIKETYLVDYQCPRFGSPAQDLYYFLMSSGKWEVKVKQFDYFIKYYHDQLVKHLKLLNYTKVTPTLRDIHIALYKYSIWGFATACGVMGVVLADPSDDANIENFAGEGEAGQKFKTQMFSNPRYRKHCEIVLPWLYNRGAF